MDDVRLAHRVRTHGVLEPDDAARLLLPVADSLASVHAASGLHGAVSPAAIEVDESGRAVLLDRTVAVPDPSFTPPELAMGLRPQPADDVWSLAAVLLHVTTGHPPEAYGTPLVVPRTTGWLGPLVELGLRADPRERPSAAEVADYLRARVDPPAERRRIGAARLVLGGVAVIALLGLAGAALLFSGGDDEAPRTRPETSGATSAEPEEEPTTVEPSESPTPPTAAELEVFARDYVVTASGDPAAGFAWLTPAYQQRSPRYREVWGAIRDPQILDISADPEAMSVTYTYRYRLAGGGSRTEEITLFLVQDDDRLLIADATAR
ncbi:hypothetical protein [Nocardioides humi]|uniref:Protein kinase domain-containing protein n=1 Tax=Nocardioides humi TaxID=449461 RepID=A0ABN2BP51_9ACTN|nr:hypothetical protein [Nocardioides humi]